MWVKKFTWGKCLLIVFSRPSGRTASSVSLIMKRILCLLIQHAQSIKKYIYSNSTERYLDEILRCYLYVVFASKFLTLLLLPTWEETLIFRDESLLTPISFLLWNLVERWLFVVFASGFRLRLHFKWRKLLSGSVKTLELTVSHKKSR